MGWFDENAPTQDLTTPTEVAPWMAQQGGVSRSTGPTGNTGVNGGGSAAYQSEINKLMTPTSAASGGDVYQQFVQHLKAAYPQKSQDANWLNQQAQYFTDKYNTGIKTSGDSPQQVLNYFLDRADGAGAGRADMAEAGKYSAQGGYTPSAGGFGGFGGGDFGGGDSSWLNALQMVDPERVNALGPANVPNVSYSGAQAAQAGPAQTANYTPFAAAQSSYAPNVSAQQLSMPNPFTGITGADVLNDPSYQFRLNQGLGALENSAAAKGILRTGGAMKGLEDYAQNFASQEFGNAYNRAAQTNQQNFGQQFQVGSTNAANNLNAAQFNAGNQQAVNLANAQLAQSAGQANAANALNAGQFNAGQANNVAQFNAGNQQAMNALNAQLGLQAQTTNAGNALGAYSAYAPLYQQAQATNAANQLGAASQNNNARLGAYNAGTNAALGFGNLGLGYQNFGLNAQNQAWNQGFQQNQANWNHGMDLANLGQKSTG